VKKQLLAKEHLIKVKSTPDIPSGAKARVDFAAFTAVRVKTLTYQSCPFKTSTYSEAS
jgi:hypothetical protein